MPLFTLWLREVPCSIFKRNVVIRGDAILMIIWILHDQLLANLHDSQCEYLLTQCDHDPHIDTVILTQCDGTCQSWCIVDTSCKDCHNTQFTHTHTHMHTPIHAWVTHIHSICLACMVHYIVGITLNVIQCGRHSWS